MSSETLVSIQGGKALTSWKNSNFLRRILLRPVNNVSLKVICYMTGIGEREKENNKNKGLAVNHAILWQSKKPMPQVYTLQKSTLEA